MVLILNLSFESNEAKVLNKHIFETIYYASLQESCNISKIDGPYKTF